jgi:hypothetical protein
MLKLVIKNDRVMKILELIEKFKVCDVTHAQRLYYSHCKYAYVKANEKLNALIKEGTLNRKRNDINSKYYYYIGKSPAQVQHKLMLTELYVRFCQIYGIDNVECYPEWTELQGIRPDAFIKLILGRRINLYFIEVQISNNPVDILKYERAYQVNKQERIFPPGVFPTVVFVTDKKISLASKNFDVIVMDTKLNLKVLEGVYEKAN